MTVRANMFTPEALLSAPRRSAGVPNDTGTRILYTTSTYSFDEHKKTSELRCLDVKTSESTLLTSDDGIAEPVWLEGDSDNYVCLKSGEGSVTEVVVASAGGRWENRYTAGRIDAPANGLKLVRLADGCLAVAVTALASPDGSLFNPEKAPKLQSTGRLYKSLMVRHWDHYVEKEKNAIWYGVLEKSNDGKYQMSGLVNALKGSDLNADSFDISKSGIIFVAKDPTLNPALSVKCNIYHIPLKTFTESGTGKPLLIPLPGYEGASSSPVFSRDGKQAAFLSMKTAGYEADRNEIFIVPDVAQIPNVELLSSGDVQKEWDRSPQTICFSRDGAAIYASAEDDGYGRLFILPLNAKQTIGKPRQLSQHGYVSDIRPLASGRVFVSSSTLVDNSCFSILDPKEKAASSEVWTHSASKNGSSLGLKPSQVSSIRFPASDPSVNKRVHAWVVKPSTFDASKKYPLALLIHGGPQGSWADSWSTRWNPAVFAEQGYIVVAPNVTGSTGYGQAFTDAIRCDWGGAPYHDLENCVAHITQNMPEVDMERAVALGASYGGYMVNWLNGHELGRRFRALVCHDGIFSMAGLLATEELYFPFHDLGGTPWTSLPADSASPPQQRKVAEQAQAVFGQSSVQAWVKNDPSRFLDHWQTPQLVIHNSKDYRLCISEGLAAFNVLQARGVESQFLTFPDENHFVLKPENALVWHKVVLNWINGHVGLPKYCAEAEEEEGGSGERFYGGRRKGELVEMVGMGKPET